MYIDDQWNVGGVSFAGFSHLKNGLPCQDAFSFAHAGNRFSAVVCDGAGSAAFSDFGARCVAEQLAQHLVGGSIPDAESLKHEILFCLGELRRAILAKFESERGACCLDISEFAATTLGFYACDDRYFFFHIGDGGGFAIIGDDFVVSAPKNGESVNETYFFTSDGLERHLRVISLGSEPDAVLLMTDGVTPMAITNGHGAPSMPSVDPVLKYLSEHTCESSRAAVSNLLSRSDVKKITLDDKTLLWVVRRGLGAA